MKADIICCYAPWYDIIGKTIQLVTGKTIVHTAISISDELVMESGPYGVRLSKISKFKHGGYDVFRCSMLTEEQRSQIVDYVMNRVEKPYDYKLALGIGINQILNRLGIYNVRTYWDNPRKDICVELIIEGFRQVDINLLPNIKDYDIIPSDIPGSSFLYLHDCIR